MQELQNNGNIYDVNNVIVERLTITLRNYEGMQMKNHDKKRLRDLLEAFMLEADDKKQDLIFEKIAKLSPDPEWSGYIFYSDEYCDEDGNVNFCKLIEKIYSYKPIIIRL